jgi:anti-sigma factor RsiW
MTLHEEWHEEWTAKLSDFLDDELTPDEHYAVESHLQGCAECTAVLDELKQVVARARTLDPRPPHADLWPGIADRVEQIEKEARPPASILPMRTRAGWRVSFTLPQLAAASVLIALMSGGMAWSLRPTAQKTRGGDPIASRSIEAAQSAEAQRAESLEREAFAERATLPVSLADAQYDAAVSDLERALKDGRGKLDPTTITIVEHNLQTIDEAIRQAREALAGDPANSYLSGHLVEARRRKLDLLRRAAALTSESD